MATPQILALVPLPKKVLPETGVLLLPELLYILLDPHPAARHVFAAERFALELPILANGNARIAVSNESISPAEELRTHFDGSIENDEGYRLTISPRGIDIYARTSAGTFYAFQTLTQIVRHVAYLTPKPPLVLPALTIEDYPDFPRRGVNHDCARGKVPKLETLLQLIDDLAGLKINEFQIYIENTFEFRKHPLMYDDTTPFTAEDILILDAACRARHIDFVPSLTSLGHFEKILRRPAFRHLAEVEPADLRKQGIETWSDDPWTLCTTDPEARQLLKDMYNEFLPNFSSPQFNICCDESWDLGKGRSKFLADQIGQGQMYVDWVNFCNTMAKSHGRRIQMWGDIILNHPDLISQLPDDVTLLEWGYEAHHDFDGHCATFAERLRTPARGGNQQFYVCPGTSSWITLASRTRNAFGSIHNAATAGLKHGATGLLNTDWGDYGHQQLLSVSLLAFAYGAAASWNIASVPNPAPKDKPIWKENKFFVGTREADLALQPFLTAASLHLFRDPVAQFATFAYQLGLTYEKLGWQRFNASLEWYLLREKFDFANYVNRAVPAGLERAANAMNDLIPKFESSDLLRADADILRREFAVTARTILHNCQRTVLRKAWLAADPKNRNPEHPLGKLPRKPLPRSFKQDMKALGTDIAAIHREYRALWLARNLPSRLADIDLELDRMQKEYKQFAKN